MSLINNLQLVLKWSLFFAFSQDVPKDDEEFYQFCYVSLSSHVHGASSPFQFVADDFEIIDESLDASLVDCDTICDEMSNSKVEIDKQFW